MSVSSTSPTNQVNINTPSNINFGQLSVLSAKIENLCNTVSKFSTCLINLQSQINNPSCCTLQGTTDAGNTTITPFGLDYKADTNVITNILYFKTITTVEEDGVGGGVNGVIDFNRIDNNGDTFISILSPRYITDDRTIYLPDNNGSLALSATINGGDPILADISGNIDLGTIATAVTLQNAFDNSITAGDSPTIVTNTDIFYLVSGDSANEGSSQIGSRLFLNNDELLFANKDNSSNRSAITLQGSTIALETHFGGDGTGVTLNNDKIEFESTTNNYSFQNILYSFPTTQGTVGQVLGVDSVDGDSKAILSWQNVESSVPNLQQVTDIGNTTTNDIVVNSGRILDNDGYIINLDTNTGQYSRFDPGYLALSNANATAASVINANATTSNRTNTLPNSSGVLALSANGITADSTGNITLNFNTGFGFTQGSVIFAGSDGNLTQDNSKFFWNDSSFRLGIGTTSPQSSLHVEGGNILVNNGSEFIQFGGFAVNDGTNGNSVKINAVANSGYSRTITINQPTASMTFTSGNTDSTGAGFTRASGGSNLSSFTIFSGRTQDNSFNPRPGSIIFQTGDASAALVTNMVIDNVSGISFNTIPAATNTKILYIDPTTKFISYGDAPSGGGAGTTNFPLSISNSGAGDVSGSTFDGSIGKTISYNSIGAAPAARTISTTAPLSGGGDLSANRTLSIADAVADGATKGAATFTASDFNSVSGLISIDYINGQSATTSTKGFLPSADWNTFNSKQAALISGTNIKTVNGISLLGSGDIPVASAWGTITGTLSSQSDLNTALGAKQATLVSGTNIKTVNGTTLLGSGNIVTTDESYQSIIFSSSLTIDLSTKRNFLISTMTGNLILAFTGVVAGRDYKFRTVQGGSGSNTITFPAGTKMPLGQGSGNVMNPTTTVGAEDWFSLWYDGSNYCVSLVPNLV